MQKKLNQSEEKGTALLSNQFRAARIRLTILYSVLLAAILLVSSVITYVSFSQRLERGPAAIIFRHIDTDGDHHDTPGEERDELLEALIFSNGILVIGAAAISYWLAGVTLRPIQASYARQQQFLSDASHELRTPLAVIKANTENVLYAGKKAQQQFPELTINLEEINRMSLMLTDLLVVSRLDEPSHGVGTESLAVNTLISDTIERFMPLAQQHRIALTYTTNPETHTITANRELLLQALGNIVKNAITYNSDGGSVNITEELTEGNLLIIVKDTGLGISKIDLPHIFDRFYRPDKSRSRQTGGSGLGLSITKAIIENCGGTVTVSSEVGKGSIFRLTIPLST